MNFYPAASGGGGNPAHQQAALAADVTITPINTFIDLLTLSLPAGNYLLLAHVSLLIGGSTDHVTVRIWDGTNTFAEGEAAPAISVVVTGPTLIGYCSLAVTTTIKLSAATISITGGVAAKADPTDNSSAAHKSTQLVAIQVA